MNDALDKFYVYRTLLDNETWGAILVTSNVSNLPNIDFGMLVFAENEKSAIVRGRELYDKTHKLDNEMNNVMEFAKAALPAAISASVTNSKGAGNGDVIGKASGISLSYGVKMNELLKWQFRNRSNGAD